MASYYVPQGPTANGISDIERELEELRDSYRQVCEERDALEDLLLQEQLKNGAPADKQLEEARAHAAALEMELQSMASRCEEWKRRAGERAAEMHPAMVQALLEERLEELDESGVLALQVECARLRDELAKSEVLRFELYRSLAQGAVEVESRWESEASGMSPRRESSLGRRDEERHSNDGDAEDASERRTTPVTMECDESVVQELLELGQASLTQEDVTRLSEAVEAAERRAEKAEREAEQRAVQVQLLEAKMAAMLSDSPIDEHKRSPSLISSSPISFGLSPIASSSSPDPASITRSSSSNASQHDQQHSQQHGQEETVQCSQQQRTFRQNQQQPGGQSQGTGAQPGIGGGEKRENSGAELAGPAPRVNGVSSRGGNVVVAEGHEWVGAGIDGKHHAAFERSTLGAVVEQRGGTEAGEKEEEMEEVEENEVEELRQMVQSVRRQNRLTHVLLSVVFAASIPPLLGMIRGLFDGGRPYQPKRSGQPPQVTRVSIRS
ncbi:hypothetical protein CLOP_g22177 [Closterium sp. NIES-67]|nr:hypothetical protein CLOP_g22177 [Closterium sp. NIES-67]